MRDVFLRYLIIVPALIGLVLSVWWAVRSRAWPGWFQAANCVGLLLFGFRHYDLGLAIALPASLLFLGSLLYWRSHHSPVV